MNWFTLFNNGTFDGASLIDYPNSGYNYFSGDLDNERITAVGALVNDCFAGEFKSGYLTTGSLGNYNHGFSSAGAKKITWLFPNENGTTAGSTYDWTINVKLEGIANINGLQLWLSWIGNYVKLIDFQTADLGMWKTANVTGLVSNSDIFKLTTPAMMLLIYDADVYGINYGTGGTISIDEIFVTENTGTPDPLTFTTVVQNATYYNGNDGSITFNITGGSGTYFVDYDDLPTSDNPNPRLNLTAGIYTGKIIDGFSLEQFPFSVEVTQPAPPPPPSGTFVEVPITNSLRFVERATPNGCEVWENADNMLFCESGDEYMSKLEYFQKVNKCDLLRIQFKSNYSQHTVRLRNYYDSSEVTTIPVDLEVQSLQIQQTENIRIQDHGGGKSRVYFTVGGALPIPLTTGEVFEIVNNADGFNGLYEILNIFEDTTIQSQYLVINKTYSIGAPSSLAEGIFISNNLEYNTYEFSVDLSGQANGYYCLTIEALDQVGGVVKREFTSEPISLEVEHKNTLYIEYANRDNAFDINYQTGISHKIRVEARNFKRIPASTQETIRNTDGQLKKLLAKPQRKFLIEFFQIPPYLHEKLSVIFNHDTIRINGIQFQTDEGYGEPQYLVRYSLSNASIVVEQSEWFKTYNNGDVGGVDGQQGLIIANEGYILR